MESFKKLLLQNKAWAKEKKYFDPEFFSKISLTQTPDFFWIGCSDSRVPANEVTDSESGEIFVHRNVANLVVEEDLSLLSGLSYAVEFLKVKHIIVCGHYNCGGVRATIAKLDHPIIGNWLKNIQKVYDLHKNELNNIREEKEKEKKLIEFNVIEQVKNLSKTSVIQNFWKDGNQFPVLHGCVFDMDHGILKEFIEINQKEIKYS